MELRQLRYFIAVAETLNLQVAARRVNICAPPLLMQIRKLQQSIGTNLFRTERRRLQLTAAGKALLPKAREIIAAANAAAEFVRSVAAGECGRLAIGCVEAAESAFLARLLGWFRVEHIRIQFALQSFTPTQQWAAIADGRLDVAFGPPPLRSDIFDVEELIRQPLVLAAPEDHPFASAITSFEAMNGVPLIVVSRAHDPDTYERIESAFHRKGMAMNVAHEADNHQSMLTMVQLGFGCCLVPEYMSHTPTLGVAYRPLVKCPPELEYVTAVIKRSDRLGLAESFWRFAALRGRLSGVLPPPAPKEPVPEILLPAPVENSILLNGHAEASRSGG